MSTSEFTTHYHLDKYAATDKPNLRDQYNAAMDKIDSQLYAASTDATDAKATANAASQAVSGKASQADLNALATEVSGKASQSSVTALATEVSGKASQSSVTALTQIVNKKQSILSDRKIVCIGDSLTHHTPVAQSWPEYLASTTGCTTYNFGVGGTGFTTGNPNFESQLANAHSSSSFNDADITDVIIIGGFNDYASNESAVTTAVANCITYARRTFVNATIHIGAMLHGVSPLDTANGGASAAQYRSRLIAPIHDACMSNGCAWIDGCWYWTVGLSNFDYGDGIHLNVNGQRYVAGYIASHLCGGSTDRIESQKLTIASGAQSYVTNLEAFAFAKGGIVNVQGKFTYAGSDSTTVFQTDIASLNGAFRSSHPNTANTVTVKTFVNAPAQGQRIYTTVPRIYTWEYAAQNSQMVSIHQLNNTVFNEILFFDLTYPFGL